MFSDVGQQPAPVAAKPVRTGEGVVPWVLPGLLVAAVGAIVIHAARKPPIRRGKAAPRRGERPAPTRR
jgi:hypothetical protein